MPFGIYKDFEECVAKNQDKSDPEAYCAAIQRKVEGAQVVNEVLMELAAAELSEENIIRNAQLMPLGKWNHPKGQIEITFEKAQKLAEQFKKGAAGQQLPVFYIHSSKENIASPLYGKAAGWFLDVKPDPQRGVVVDIQFTEDGAKAVKSGEYRFLSAEYYDKVQLPHHDTPQEDVIVGASLVNRPHLKGMDPILNEETGHQLLHDVAKDPSKGGGPVDPILRQLCEAAKISLSEDQTELTEEQRSALTEFLEQRDKELTDAKAQSADLQKQLSEKEGKEEAQMRTLREAGFEEEAKLLEEIRVERFERQLSEYLPEDKELSKVGREAAQAYAKNRSEDNLNALHEALLSGKGLAQVKPRGADGPGQEPNEGESVSGKFLEEANKLSQERKIDLTEAMVAIQAEKPELWNAYQDEIGAPWAKVEVK